MKKNFIKCVFYIIKISIDFLMEEGNLAVLVDAKTEYTKQLINILKMNIYFAINKLFSESKNECIEENIEYMVLNKFQEKLSNIPNWNQNIINTEYDNVTTTKVGDFISDYISNPNDSNLNFTNIHLGQSTII